MQQDYNPWQTISSKQVYQNPWMKVIEDKVRTPNGKEGIYGFIEGGTGVFVIALNQTEEVYLIESFRYPMQKWQWELPSGSLDAGSTLLEAAKNELAEELGMTAEKWTLLNTCTPSHNGFMKDAQSIFIAEGLKDGERHLGDFEAIRSVKSVSYTELMSMIQKGSLTDGQSLAALMQFVAWRGKQQA